MAKLMSKKTREIVWTVAVIVIVILFVVFYIVYPLSKVPDLTARPDRDKFEDPEFVMENDAGEFLEAGLRPDTFTVTTDDNLGLAALYFSPDTNVFDTARGTVILLHSGDTDRTSLIPYVVPLLDSGLAVVAYDQRACGRSQGKYHYAGVYESDDLMQAIVNLNIHGRLFQPLIVAGFGLGADAAINAAREEERINTVVAVEPYLTSSRWISGIRRDRGALAIPLYNMVYFWWYSKLTGNAFGRTGVGDIEPAGSRTVLIMSEAGLAGKEAVRLGEISSGAIETTVCPLDPDKLEQLVLETIYKSIPRED
jgi:pimeloyl-ACP methyl ester carboxylesterase